MKKIFLILAVWVTVLFMGCDNGTSSGSGLKGSENDTNNPPQTPTGISAAFTTTNAILLTWNSVENATGYYVYSATSSSGIYSKSEAISETSMTFDGLASATTRYFKLSAYNKHGESEQSSVVSGTTQSSGSGGNSGSGAGCLYYQDRINGLRGAIAGYQVILKKAEDDLAYMRANQHTLGFTSAQISIMQTHISDTKKLISDYQSEINKTKSEATATGCSV